MIALLVLLRAPQAQEYAFPTSSADYGYFYPTAYFDHNSSSSLDDWSCGSITYDGHSGNDFGVGSWSGMDAGRDITAAADGIVVSTHDGEYDRCSSGTCGSSNNVFIEHADGKETFYLHMRKGTVQVSVGEVVSCGQKLGEVGSSGNSTGPHLHFGVYSSGGSVKDPFYGSCSSGTNYWVSQGSYDSLPSRTCDPTVTPVVPTAALIATSTDARRSTDVNGDRRADVCARANAGVLCELGSASGLVPGFATTLVSNDSGLNASPDHYASLRMGDVTGDKRDDLCFRTDTAYECHASTGDGFSAEALPGAPDWSNSRGFDDAEHYTTIRMAELNGDGRLDLCARSADGIECALATATGFGPTFAGPAWSDASGWNDHDNYATLRFGDINGDGLDDLCGRANAGMRCYRSTGEGFEASSLSGPAWSDDEGFDNANKYSSIHLYDIDGDGLADLFARTADGISVALSTGEGFGAEMVLASYKDSSGWDDPDNAFTIRLGDLDGDGDADLCGRSNSSGMVCRRWVDGAFEASNLAGPDWDDDHGWDAYDNYWSISFADFNGDGMDDLCGRAPTGFVCAPSTGEGFGAVVTDRYGTDSAGWNGGDNWPTTLVGGPDARGCPDADLDFTCDDADRCPTDPNKTDPGLCGCFAIDVDHDADGVCDVEDLCPDDSGKTDPGVCGCGLPEDDTDDDGIIDCVDEQIGPDEAPGAPDTGEGPAAEPIGTSQSKEQGGCATAGQPAPLLALGGLLLLGARRRRL